MEEFIVKSNYPKKEYIKYLESVIDSAQNDLIKSKNENTRYCIGKGINEIYKTIKRLLRAFVR